MLWARKPASPLGAQAQVGFVETACAGGGGKPVGQAAGEAAVHVACVGMGVVVKIDQVEVGGVAEFFAAEFATADDGELRGCRGVLGMSAHAHGRAAARMVSARAESWSEGDSTVHSPARSWTARRKTWACWSLTQGVHCASVSPQKHRSNAVSKAAR